MYKHRKESQGLILSGFRKAYISDAVREALSLVQLCENPFREI